MPGKFLHLHVLYTFQRQVNFRKYRWNRGSPWTLARVNTANIFLLLQYIFACFKCYPCDRMSLLTCKVTREYVAFDHERTIQETRCEWLTLYILIPE